jgi:hypothetical protein
MPEQSPQHQPSLQFDEESTEELLSETPLDQLEEITYHERHLLQAKFYPRVLDWIACQLRVRDRKHFQIRCHYGTKVGRCVVHHLSWLIVLYGSLRPKGDEIVLGEYHQLPSMNREHEILTSVVILLSSSSIAAL